MTKETDDDDDKDTQAQLQEANILVFMLLLTICIVIGIIAAAIFVVAARNGEMPSTDALLTLLSHMLDLLFTYMAQHPPSPPPTQ